MTTFTSGIVFSQHNADDIIGYYYVVDPFTDEASQIYISRNSSGEYEGKITWINNPEKQSFMGLLFLKELKYDPEKKEWNKGSIKYPGKKGNFSVNMHFQDHETLKVRGYWGMAMLGKTVYWKKEKEQRK